MYCLYPVLPPLLQSHTFYFIFATYMTFFKQYHLYELFSPAVRLEVSIDTIELIDKFLSFNGKYFNFRIILHQR